MVSAWRPSGRSWKVWGKALDNQHAPTGHHDRPVAARNVGLFGQLKLALTGRNMAMEIRALLSKMPVGASGVRGTALQAGTPLHAWPWAGICTARGPGRIEPGAAAPAQPPPINLKSRSEQSRGVQGCL